MSNVNAAIRFDAPQVAGNLVIVTGRVDNSQIFNADIAGNTADGTTHNKGFIDVSNFMKEVLSFRYVSTQPIDLQHITLGTNLDDNAGALSAGGSTNDIYINVPVLGGSGTGMQVALVLVDTRNVPGTIQKQECSLIYSDKTTRQSAAGRGYQVGEIVELDIPTTSGTDRPKCRIVPAGWIARTHSFSPANEPQKAIIIHSSSQPTRQVTKPASTFIEERNKVYLRGPVTNGDVHNLTENPVNQVGLQLPSTITDGESQRAIFGHFKFIIIGRR